MKYTKSIQSLQKSNKHFFHKTFAQVTESAELACIDYYIGYVNAMRNT